MILCISFAFSPFVPGPSGQGTFVLFFFFSERFKPFFFFWVSSFVFSLTWSRHGALNNLSFSAFSWYGGAAFFFLFSPLFVTMGHFFPRSEVLVSIPSLFLAEWFSFIFLAIKLAPVLFPPPSTCVMLIFCFRCLRSCLFFSSRQHWRKRIFALVPLFLQDLISLFSLFSFL